MASRLSEAEIVLRSPWLALRRRLAIDAEQDDACRIGLVLRAPAARATEGPRDFRNPHPCPARTAALSAGRLLRPARRRRSALRALSGGAPRGAALDRARQGERRRALERGLGGHVRDHLRRRALAGPGRPDRSGRAQRPCAAGLEGGVGDPLRLRRSRDAGRRADLPRLAWRRIDPRRRAAAAARRLLWRCGAARDFRRRGKALSSGRRPRFGWSSGGVLAPLRVYRPAPLSGPARRAKAAMGGRHR